MNGEVEMYENIKQIIIKLWEIVENIVEFIIRVLGSIWRLVLKILGYLRVVTSQLYTGIKSIYSRYF